MISICVGTYGLPNFAELQLRSLRNIFGSSPILVYDGLSPESGRIKEIADQFDCSYLSEKINRNHFSGCTQTAVCSVAFGHHVESEISLKINQRFVLLDESIPDRLEEVFADPKITLAMPPTVKIETIRDSQSKFHAALPSNPTMLAFRTSAVDAQWIADAYAEQVKTDTSRHGSLTELFWAKQIESKFKGRFIPLEFLSTPTEPPLYLSKIQHSDADFQKAALKLGMQATSFQTQEWSKLSGPAYRPIPRAV